MLEIIGANEGQIIAIVASNDGTATGAVPALEENKLDGRVFVSGQDADLAPVICLPKGTQVMTGYTPVISIATQTADIAVDLARGRSLFPRAIKRCQPFWVRRST